MEEKKIDKRKSLYIVLDTEATNCIEEENFKSALVYDLGYSVVDKEGNVYATKSLVITDIYNEQPELMKTAYYANKLPQYEEELINGTRILTTIQHAKAILANDCKAYNVKAIIAHNAYFDYKALVNTIRYITKSQDRQFYPYGIELWDSLKMARDTICKQALYIKWCTENGYLDKRNKPRATAEILYRYITNNNNFIEKHTGLEDVMIEKEIFALCLRQHKKMNKKLFKD